MKTMFRENHITNQARIFTALILTGILSVGSGLTLINSASATPSDLLPATTNEIYQNKQQNRLPSSVANAVLKDLANRTGISVKKLQITAYSKRTWNDGCLGLAKPDEFCTQALVPGWQVVVSSGKQQWVYHTNNNGRSLRLASGNTSSKEELPRKVSDTLKPVPIPASELPPPLDQGVVFRQISSGGFAARTYETVLRNDGTLIRVRIGDANDSERSVRRVSPQQLKRFQQILRRNRREFNNLSYPAPQGAADFITFTITSREGTVQYNDISQNNLPRDLQQVITAWNQLLANSQ